MTVPICIRICRYKAHPAIDQQETIYQYESGCSSSRLYDLKKSSFVPRIVYAGVDIQNSDGTVSSVLAVDSLVLGKRTECYHCLFSIGLYTNWRHITLTVWRVSVINGDIWKNHSIGFANLPSGDFVLEVKSTNGDGVLYGAILPLFTYIFSPVHGAAWAWVLYVLIAIILILTVSSIIVYHELETESNFRTAVDRSGNYAFYWYFAWALRTPLTLISGSIEEIVEREDNCKRAGQRICR